MATCGRAHRSLCGPLLLSLVQFGLPVDLPVGGNNKLPNSNLAIQLVYWLARPERLRVRASRLALAHNSASLLIIGRAPMSGARCRQVGELANSASCSSSERAKDCVWAADCL